MTKPQNKKIPILEDSVFEIFLQKDDEQVAKERLYAARESIDACFQMAIVAVLKKNASEARSYLGRMNNLTRNSSLDEDAKLALNMASKFLMAHIARIELKFTEAVVKEYLVEGFSASLQIGRFVFARMFLGLAGWAYRYLGHKGVQEDFFRMQEAFSSKTLNVLWRYNQSYLDRNNSFHTEMESYCQVSDEMVERFFDTPNGRYISLLKTGQDIDPSGLDDDTFILARNSIKSYYFSRELSPEQKGLFIEKYQHFYQLQCVAIPKKIESDYSSLFEEYLKNSWLYGKTDVLKEVLQQSVPTVYEDRDKLYLSKLKKEMDVRQVPVFGTSKDVLRDLFATWQQIVAASLRANIRDDEHQNEHGLLLNLLLFLYRQCGDFRLDISSKETVNACTVIQELLRKIPEIQYDNTPMTLMASLDVPIMEASNYHLLDNDSLSSVITDQYLRRGDRFAIDLESLLSKWEGHPVLLEARLRDKVQTFLQESLPSDWVLKSPANLFEKNGLAHLQNSKGESVVAVFLFPKGRWLLDKMHKNIMLKEKTGIQQLSPWLSIDDYLKSDIYKKSLGTSSTGQKVLKLIILGPAVFLDVQNDNDPVSMLTLSQFWEILTGADSEGMFDAFLQAKIPENRSYEVLTSDPWDLKNLYRLCREGAFYSENGFDGAQASSFGLSQVLKNWMKNLDLKHPSEASYVCSLPHSPFSFNIRASVREDGSIDIVALDLVQENRKNEQEGFSVESDDAFYFVRGQKFGLYHQGVVSKAGLGTMALSQDVVISTFENSLSAYSVHYEGVKSDYALTEFLVSAERLKYARKVAKSAIMARNMSHNLGSHVMAYLKQKLISVEEIRRQNVLEEIISCKDGKYVAHDALGDDVAVPFLVGLGRFLSYLQERQDFIASVATDFVPYCAALNFKDFIYDELNPDKRYKRHSDKKINKPENILLGNIARSEGLFRPLESKSDTSEPLQRDIVLKFQDFDGEPVASVEGSAFDPEKHYGERLTRASAALDAMRDYNLYIPGGITGRHAIFSILENAIRNAAKHGNWRQQRSSLEMTFEIFSARDYQNASDADNIEGELSLREVLEKFYVPARDGQRLYYITLTDNLDTSYASLQKLREYLYEDYVDDEGRTKETAKGVKEMRICALWLRGIDLAEEECFIQNSRSKHDSQWILLPSADGIPAHAPALYARLSTDKKETNTGHLQYIFAVKIPVKVLVLSNGIVSPTVKERFVSNDWLVMSKKDFMSDGECGRLNENYDFMLLDKGISKETVRPYSNSRLYTVQDIKSSLTTLFDENTDRSVWNQSANDLFEHLLEKLADYKEGKDKISILDDHSYDKSNLPSSLFVGQKSDYSLYNYEKHFETENLLTDYLRDIELYQYDIRFIEGISGGNSTDRIVRTEQLNREWFYRNLHAMKQHIAVFDERLFKKVMNPQTEDITGEELVSCEDGKGIIFDLKNIRLFNIIQSSSTIWNIVGLCRGNEELRDGKSRCAVIATLKRDEKGTFKIAFTERGYGNSQRFDRISIHQGLLDKIYTDFGVKGNPSAMELVTQTLFQKFSSNQKEYDALKKMGKEYFYPGMTIHSGRSKPAEVDMPQRLPFIQYASLEHAVMDCKYSLTELLDMAYYEQSDCNFRKERYY